MLDVEKIRQILVKRGITSTQFMREIFGARIKQSLSYLSSRPGITFSKVESIADYLGVPVDSIRYSPDVKDTQIKERNLADEVKSLRSRVEKLEKIISKIQK